MKNILLVSLLLLALSCTRPPDYPIEPVIEFVSLSKNTFSQRLEGVDEIILTLSFTDGDGDIGNSERTPDNEDIIIIDTRDGGPEAPNHLVQIPPAGSNNGVSGEIYITLLGTCCTYPPSVPDLPCMPATTAVNQDTLIYEIYIKDRAGNESNILTLEPIYITCD